MTHSRPYTNTGLLGRVSCTQGRACTLTRVHPPGPTCQDRHRRTQARRCTRAHTGVQRPGLAAMHMAGGALASLPPDDSGSAVPVSRAAAGQPSSDRSDGRAHRCLEEALAASASRARGMMKHSPGLQVGPRPSVSASCTAVFSQGNSKPGAGDPAFPWLPGDQLCSACLGAGHFCALGAAGSGSCLCPWVCPASAQVCQGSQPACLSVGAWEQAHRPFPMTLALLGMGPREAVWTWAHPNEVGLLCVTL